MFTPIASVVLASAALGHVAAPPTIASCNGAKQVRPAEITLFCADANQSLTHLHWSDWGKARTEATAIEVTNTCTPTCVAGTEVSRRVRVTVSDLRDGRYRVLTVGRQRFDLTVRGPVVA